MADSKFNTIAQPDNFRVHLWIGGRDKGRVSCPIGTWEQAEAWIADWKAVAPRFENVDLRIHDARSVGYVSDLEAV